MTSFGNIDSIDMQFCEFYSMITENDVKERNSTETNQKLEFHKVWKKNE